MDKKQRNLVLLSDSFLVAGLLGYAIIFFLMNRSFDLTGTAMSASQMEQRLFLRRLAETLCAVFSALYSIGQIYLTWYVVKNRLDIAFRQIFVYFAVQVVLALVCVLPFAVADVAFFYDYLFPLRSLGLVLLVLLTSLCLIRLFRKSMTAST